MTLDWASPYPTTVTATSTLEDFEWQDRYPTAKIRETYTGPASFQPRPGSPLPFIQSQDIKFERIIYFAYNSGRIVRMQTTLTLTTTAPGLLSTSAAQGGQYQGGQGGQYQGGQYSGRPNIRRTVPGRTGPGGAVPGRARRSNSGRSQYPGGQGGTVVPAGSIRPIAIANGGMSPGRDAIPAGNYPGAVRYAAAEPVATKLKYTDTSVILI